MWLKHRLLLCACLLTATLVTGHDIGRGLLNTKKKEKEQAREDDALEAHFIRQATLNKEQERVLLFASEEAVGIVKKVDKSGRKKQAKIITDLWENAKGVTIVKTLALLVELSPKKRTYFFGVNSDAMDMAEGNGYSFKVSEAVYNALAITDPGNDHYHLLDALLYRMEQKNKKSKGSGCQYIEFLFTDAEAWALDDGRAQQFFRGFDNKDYLPLTECFLEECKGKAAKCCGDKKAVSSGLCGCKIVDKKKKTMQCAHNLFWTAPRVIWLCGTQNCDPDEKCICADPKAKKSKKGDKSKSSKGKGKSSGKGKDDDEPKKGKKDKEDEKSSKETKSKKSKGKSEKSGKETKSKGKPGKETKGKSDKDVEKTSKSKSKSEKEVKKSKGKSEKEVTKSSKKSKGKSEKDVEKTSKSKSKSEKEVKKSKGKSEKEVTKSSKSKQHSKSFKESTKTVRSAKKGDSKTEVRKHSKGSSKGLSKKSSKHSVKGPFKARKPKKSDKPFVKKTSSKATKKTKYERTRRET